MSARDPMWRRVARLHGPDVRRDVDDEFAFHLQMREAELVERGLAPQAARQEALRRFGDLHGARGTCTAVGERRARRRRLGEWLATLRTDARYALRALHRQPGFATCVVLTIALGIGVNAALFGVLDALMLRPLPAERPGELVRVYTSNGRATPTPADRFGATSYADYVDLRTLRRAFAGVVAYLPIGTAIRTADAVQPLQAEAVSADYFRVLGIRPRLGRFFVSEDDDAAAPAVVVLAHGLWQRAFGADSAVLGRTVMLGGAPFTVVGVAPPTFTGLGLGRIDAYVPYAASPRLTGDVDRRADRAQRATTVLARLAPGVSLAQAQGEATALMRVLSREHAETNAGRQFTLVRARSVLAVADTEAAPRRIALLLLAVTAAVFAVALLNVVTLVLARATGRRREIAVRLALGAGRARVARHLLVDGALLALASGLVAFAAMTALPPIARRLGVPPAVRLDVDWRVALFTGGTSLIAAVALGLAPLLQVRVTRPATTLRAGATPEVASVRARRALVAAQLTLSVLLLVVGLGLLESLRRQRGTGPGFAVERLVVASFRDLGVPSPVRDAVLAAEALRRVRAVPGVVAATSATNAPLTSDGSRTTVVIPGYVPARGEDMDVAAVQIGPDYFRTLGVRLRRGAEVSEPASGATGDTVPRIVVDVGMARRYWPGRDPVGAELLLGGARGRALRVVGVADDIRLRSLAEPPRPTFFVQRPAGGGATLLVRTADDPARIVARLRGVLGDLPADYALDRIVPMADVVGESLLASRLAAWGVGAFGVLTLLLALVGLHGVVGYLVAQRTREFGVRIALGARPADLFALVVRQGVTLAAAAAGVGVALGIASARGLVAVAPLMAMPDPWWVLGATALLLLAACVATLAPARRANAVDPAETLRAE